MTNAAYQTYLKIVDELQRYRPEPWMQFHHPASAVLASSPYRSIVEEMAKARAARETMRVDPDFIRFGRGRS